MWSPTVINVAFQEHWFIIVGLLVSPEVSHSVFSLQGCSQVCGHIHHVHIQLLFSLCIICIAVALVDHDPMTPLC